ncbi:MAG: substrate-binding domain-containing protein [Dermatophilaceae bacterium]
MTLVSQVTQGAPADLIALAGTSAEGPLDKSRIVGDTRSLASNTLEIATPPSSPGKVNAITDLSRPTLNVVLCAATVPCGNAATKVLSVAGVVAHVVSYETDVKATLAKVQLGEADAAIVYRSDVVAAGARVRGVLIPAWVAIAVLLVPLVALLLKTDWAGIPAHLANPTVVPSLRLSLLTTSSTLVICALIGTPLAWLLARSTHRATSWLRALVTVPWCCRRSSCPWWPQVLPLARRWPGPAR